MRWALTAALLAACASSAWATDVSVEGLTIRLEERKGTLRVFRDGLGDVLAPSDLGLGAPRTVEADDGVLRASYGPEGTLQCRLDPDGLGFEVRASRPGGREAIEWAWPLRMGEDPVPGWRQSERSADRGVLTMTLGSAEVPGAPSVFDRERDLALSLVEGRARIASGSEGYALRGAWGVSGSFRVRLQPHYYRDGLGLRYYAPLRKRSYWHTAPCVAMTWYGIRAYQGRPAQTLERLLPEMDWVRDHLLPWDPNLIFQLDDNYLEGDDALMRRLSDEIRARGMIPGVWFTPYTVAPNSLEATHPEWFLHDAQGSALNTFGGISYNQRTLNVENPEAVEAWFARWWRKACHEWGYDFFKIDGQPDVVNAYRNARDANGIESYRRGLRIGRSIVGPDRFINGCWGTPVEGVGIMDGSRTGGDTGDFPHALDVVIRWNWLNNIAWWSDPDAAANLATASVERVRLNTQARSLTGQQFLTDEQWTNVPDSTAYAWQRAMPNLDIRPANLYPIEDWTRYDVFDLKVGKAGLTWDVAGVHNFTGEPKTRTLDPAELGLPAASYRVYDYWRSEASTLAPGEGLRVDLAPWEGRLFAIRPAAEDGRPELLSTSRHISQGGLDLERYEVRRLDGAWRVSGTSSHLVEGDPYSITLWTGPLEVVSSDSTAGAPTVNLTGSTTKVTLPASASGEASWQLVLRPRNGGGLAAACASVTLDASSGATGVLKLSSLGSAPVQWHVSEAPSWCRVATEGSLGAWPESGEVAVSADLTGLALGTTFVDTLVLTPSEGAAVEVPVSLRTLEPDNLARGATAWASSEWDPGYAAGLAIDGDPATRWNSGVGERTACWLELAWPRPVTVDLVEVDEVLSWGPRVQKWSLQAEGADGWREVASGEGLGVRRIELAEPVTASRLRLRILTATDTPTISEVRVANRRP